MRPEQGDVRILPEPRIKRLGYKGAAKVRRARASLHAAGNRSDSPPRRRALETIVGIAAALITAVTAVVAVAFLMLELEDRRHASVTRNWTFLYQTKDASKNVGQVAVLESLYADGADLRNIDMRGKFLEGLRLSGADLSGAVFSDSRLRGADFEGANLQFVIFSGATMAGANFRKSDLRLSIFVGSNLVDAVFGGADIRGAYFHKAGIGGANFAGAEFGGNQQFYTACARPDNPPLLPDGYKGGYTSPCPKPLLRR